MNNWQKINKRFQIIHIKSKYVILILSNFEECARESIFIMNKEIKKIFSKEIFALIIFGEKNIFQNKVKLANKKKPNWKVIEIN